MKKTSAFYQNPALWLVVMVPLVAVIVGIGMLIVSIYSFDGLVVDDYYKRGKEINVTLERDKNAAKYDLFADIDLDQPNSAITLELSAEEGFQAPETIKLQFLHRTLSGRDLLVELNRLSGLRYSGVMPELSESRWLVELGTPQWRLTGGVVWPVESSFELESERAGG